MLTHPHRKTMDVVLCQNLPCSTQIYFRFCLFCVDHEQVETYAPIGEQFKTRPSTEPYQWSHRYKYSSACTVIVILTMNIWSNIVPSLNCFAIGPCVGRSAKLIGLEYKHACKHAHTLVACLGSWLVHSWFFDFYFPHRGTLYLFGRVCLLICVLIDSSVDPFCCKACWSPFYVFIWSV